ncbi:rhodanese-related sulfurtransferase [Bacillus ectoiniformans]|uniref:rhodanese-like domain-containing protein n=1 Tax=Bacillus ectoiniformans TaxID=1494429 RepID=UPI00195E182C|nr:rhodanese-like domain-containing protein [Bacillus ectoiniformans]MBM7647470.1 rhodanese-related sulfurtransferase [Bacillus ectoiniformans]
MKHLSAQEVEALVIDQKDVNIIDVREAAEVAQGKIPGAVNIPLGLLEFRMHELDKSKEYVMVCRSGGRSGQASQFLEGHGFKVINMDGGMMSYTGDVE